MEKIKIVAIGYTTAELAKDLEKALQPAAVSVEIIPLPARYDEFALSSEESAIIVSGIGMLSALIHALLVFISSRKAGKITIVGTRGRKVEFPKDTPKEKIEEYVAMAIKMDDIQHIKVKADPENKHKKRDKK